LFRVGLVTRRVSEELFVLACPSLTLRVTSER
jgi:hypothetical protein